MSAHGELTSDVEIQVVLASYPDADEDQLITLLQEVQGRCGFGMQVGLVEVVVHGLAHEVIGSGVEEGDGDGAVERAYID